MSMNDLISDIHARIQSMPEADELVTNSGFQERVEEIVASLLADPEFVRKMRFNVATGGDPKLSGSIYARYGYSVADLEFLFDLQTAVGRANPQRHNGPSERLRNAFEHVSNAIYIPEAKVREMDKRALDNTFSRIPKHLLSQSDLAHFERGDIDKMGAYQRALRAMDTAETGYGLQLIGAQYVGSLWEAAREQSRLFSLLETFEMTDPTAYLPVEADFPEMLFVSESTGDPTMAGYTQSATGSNRVQVSAKKFVIHQIWSGEMEEDSIIPYIPFLRRQVQLSLGFYTDSAVLNGDTTNAGTGNINLDDADPSDTKHYLAFDGIRHAALVDNTNNVTNIAGAITYDALMDVKDLLVDDTYKMNWGDPNMPSDLVYVADPRTAHRIARLDEVVNSKIERERPLLAGEVADILGHPVISTLAMSLTEADGKVSTTGTNNTLGQVAVFNRRGLVAGWRRRVKLAAEYLPGTDQYRMVHSLRMGLGRYSPTGAASGLEFAGVLRNISL